MSRHKPQYVANSICREIERHKQEEDKNKCTQYGAFLNIQCSHCHITLRLLLSYLKLVKINLLGVLWFDFVFLCVHIHSFTSVLICSHKMLVSNKCMCYQYLWQSLTQNGWIFFQCFSSEEHETQIISLFSNLSPT